MSQGHSWEICASFCFLSGPSLATCLYGGQTFKPLSSQEGPRLSCLFLAPGHIATSAWSASLCQIQDGFCLIFSEGSL